VYWRYPPGWPNPAMSYRTTADGLTSVIVDSFGDSRERQQPNNNERPPVPAQRPKKVSSCCDAWIPGVTTGIDDHLPVSGVGHRRVAGVVPRLEGAFHVALAHRRGDDGVTQTVDEELGNPERDEGGGRGHGDALGDFGLASAEELGHRVPAHARRVGGGQINHAGQ
jgi:hypothetical protein